MTQQLAEATSSWRVRITVALVLLLAAAGTVFSLQKDARAVLPDTTATVSQSPAGPATVLPGTPITYTLTVTLTSDMTTLASDDMTVELSGDSGLVGRTIGCAGDALTNLGSVCHQDNDVNAGVYTMTVSGTAPASGSVTPPTLARVCYDSNDNVSCVGEPAGNIVNATIPGTGFGTLTVAGVPTPAPATNVITDPHTFVFDLAGGFTCESDATTGDATIECAAGDVTVVNGGGANASLASVTVVGTNVEVALNASTTPGTTNVTLAIQFDTGDGFIDTPNVTAVKTWQSVADFIGANACILHVDSDIYHESEALQGLDFSSDLALAEVGLDGLSEFPGVLLDENGDDPCDALVDDPDQAIGGPHYACIFDSGLTFAANGGDITWTINGPPAAAGVDVLSYQDIVGGQAPDFPCVRWSSAGIGDQDITATYDPDGPGGVAGEVIYSNGVNDFGGDQPLVKQWNTIDETWLIKATGWLDYDNNNTDELDCWGPGINPADKYMSLTAANCDVANRDNRFGGRANVDGAEYTINGTLFQDGDIYVGDKQFPSFIDYVLGQHDAYQGPIDGAEQTYTISGECGSLALEDPTDGSTIYLSVNGMDDDSATVLSSDKGVAFQVKPTWFANTDAVDVDNADCEPGDTTTVTISTEEYINYDSPLDTADDETITITWTAQTFPKQPLLAWAGQRVVLEHNWADPDGECTIAEVDRESTEYFRVLYSLQNQSGGSFIGLQQWGGGPVTNDVDLVGMDALVEVSAFADPLEPNSDCISRIGFENQDPGEVDIIAQPVDDDDELDDSDIIGPSVAFLVYYMKFEDIQLSVVAGERKGHNDGDFSSGNPWSTATDKTDVDWNVSADILVRARVRGYVPCGDTLFGGIANCTLRQAGVDSNQQVLPQGRWVFPDDWRQLAGGDLAETMSPNYDLMIDPAVVTDDLDCDVDEDKYVEPTICESLTPLWDASGKITHNDVVGPTSLLDGWYEGDSLAPISGDIDPLAPTILFRETLLADRKINAADAPMPVAEVRFMIDGAGFLKEASKGFVVGNNVYWSGENPYYATEIPAEPWISKNNVRGGGYEWDSWGNDGAYEFWQAVQTGDLVYSAPGADTAAGKLTNPNLSKKGGAAAYVESGALLSDDDGGLDTTETQVGLTAAGSIANGDTIRIEGEDMLVTAGGGTTSLTVVRYQATGDPSPLTHGNGQKVRIATGGQQTGWDEIYVYSDNHGEAMVWANGDAGLSFSGCQDAIGPDGVGDGTVVSIDGFLCQDGDVVGASTITATVQYPDFIKHSALSSNEVTVDWTWGGHKYVTVEDDPGGTDLFKYVVLHLADRDGFCGSSPSLHPVLGEPVRFVIDGNPAGGIPIDDAAQLGSITNGGYQADVVTFDTDDAANAAITVDDFIAVDGECQAWVKLSNSLLGIINIKVTAWDPEGTITWDVLVDFTGESEPQDLVAGWNLIVWAGEDGIAPAAGLAAGTPSLTGKVSAIYGWEAATQSWLSYFPLANNVPPALQNLTGLETDEAYWMYLLEAVADWTVPTNQD